MDIPAWLFVDPNDPLKYKRNKTPKRPRPAFSLPTSISFKLKLTGFANLAYAILESCHLPDIKGESMPHLLIRYYIIGILLIVYSTSQAQTLLIQPASVEFGGKVITESATRATTITLANTGSTSLSVSQVSIVAPNSNSFSIVSYPTSSPLQNYPEAKTEVAVVFHPQSIGELDSVLQIITENPVTTHTVPLKGVGMAARGTVHNGKFIGLGPGNSTVGAGGDYATLREAFDDVSFRYLTGGNWTFTILSDLVETETSWLGVHHTNGHTITVRPAPGVFPTIYYPTSKSIYIGASSKQEFGNGITSTRDITIDGSHVDNGSDRALTIKCSSPFNYNQPLIGIAGDSDNIKLKNLRVVNAYGTLKSLPPKAIGFMLNLGPDAAYDAPVVPATSPDNGVVENCEIYVDGIGTCTGIFYGQGQDGRNQQIKPVTPGGRGLVIQNNLIYTNCRGIDLAVMRDAEITSNTINVMRPEFDSSNVQIIDGVISVAGSQGSSESGYFDISRNTILLNDASTSQAICGVILEGRSVHGTIALVRNNIISGLCPVLPGPGPKNRVGIATRSAAPTQAILVNNSIEIVDNEASTTASLTSAIGTLSTVNIGNMIIRNNITRIGARGATAYYFSPGSGLVDANNNVIFTTDDSVVALHNDTYYRSMSSWRDVTGNDLSSHSYDPYISMSGGGTWNSGSGNTAAELHFSDFPGNQYLVPTSAWASSDIDGEIRNTVNSLAGADDVVFPASTVMSWSVY